MQRQRLSSLVQAVPIPRSYFHGRTHVESCIPNNILIFRRTTGADLRRATFELRPHHRFVLIFNLTTVGIVRVDGAEVKLRPGQGMLILPYQFHAFPETRREQILWLFVTFECDRPAPLEQLRGKVFRFGASVRQRLISSLGLYRSDDGEYANQTLAFEVASLLAQLQSEIRDSKGPPAAADRQSRQLLDEINGYLRQARPGASTVQDAAKHLSISESRLRARFRAACGSSLGYYLRNYRLHLTIECIRDTRRNFTQIASDLGFPDSAAFTRFVRNQTGYTPTQFRRRMIS